MKISKMFLAILVFLFLTMTVGATLVVAESGGGKGIKESTKSNQYLPIVFRQQDPLAIKMDRDALIALYQSTNGAGWVRSGGWLGPGDHCNWYGVVCVHERVTELYLYENNLSGPIPPQMGNLSRLKYLTLTVNQLSGTIPPELAKLFNLRVLDLRFNLLSGTIPAELANLNKLQVLGLGSNQLSGPIPKELGNLSNLKWLFMGSNQLSGSIPKELSNLSNLKSLWLDNNQLSGPIPKELDKLSNLHQIFLAHNQLSCWETSDVLQWALGVHDRDWDYPTPGEVICP